MSCTPSVLTSVAKDSVRAPNGNETLTPVGHVNDDGVHSDLGSETDRGTLTQIISQTVVNYEMV